MIEKEYIELINKKIDKTISLPEEERLQEYLLEHNEAREYLEDLLLVSEYLSRLPDPEPVPGLEKRIMNSIDFGKYTKKPLNKLVSLQKFFEVKSRPKLAYLFLGMFLFFVFYSILNVTSFNKKDIRGTMGIDNSREYVIDKVSIDYSDVFGNIELKRAGNSFWFDVNLNSSERLEMEIKYEKMVKFEDLSSDFPGALQLRKSDNLVQISNPAGEHLMLYFSKKSAESASLNFQIRRSGGTVLQQKFVVK